MCKPLNSFDIPIMIFNNMSEMILFISLDLKITQKLWDVRTIPSLELVVNCLHQNSNIFYWVIVLEAQKNPPKQMRCIRCITKQRCLYLLVIVKGD